MRMRLLWIAAVLLCCGAAQAATDFAWWKDDLPYRVPVVVKTAGVEEIDAPVQVQLNFTSLLPGGEQLDPNSIHVVEQDAQSGAVLEECPALFQPVDDYFRGVAPLDWQKPYDPTKPPLIRATSENPLHPASGLIDGSGFWESGNTTPPWTIAVDLGEVRTINTVLARGAYDGYGHIITQAHVEVATESADGLTAGNWERVGGWDGDTGFINGYTRPIFFAPRPVRYVRLVVDATSSVDQGRVDMLQVYRPLWDPDNREEGRVSWYVPGKFNGERTFFVYFDSLRAQPRPPLPVPAQVAVMREAEETASVPQSSGLNFSPAYDKTASGPTDPNMLTYNWTNDFFTMTAAWPVTLPRTDTYTIAMRVRGNAGDHEITVVWDGKTLFKGNFGIEGGDWNIVALQPQQLTEGVHSLELWMKKGTGPRPLDLDVVMLTNAPKFLPNQVLLAYPGAVEAQP